MNTVCCVLGRMEEQTSRCSFSGDSHFIYDKVYKTQDLIDSDDVFFAATGVSSGELLKGVRYFSGGSQTQSCDALPFWHRPLDRCLAQL
jgi:fructose-1,6-bisphosphatase/sedoheptulose 1,7-bisphosphatase-like protein